MILDPDVKDLFERFQQLDITQVVVKVERVELLSDALSEQRNI